MQGAPVRRALNVLTVVTLLVTSQLSAQKNGGIQPDCMSGCLPQYAVEVTPDGSAIYKSSLGTYTVDFSVRNAGTTPDTWDLSCGGSGVITCQGLSQSTISLDIGEMESVTVTYSASGAGTGTLLLTADADGHSMDNGSYSITINGPGAPVISTAPQNTSYQDYSKCVAACFNGVYQYSTPAYFSLGQARTLSLTYNSATHKPRPVVWVDVSENPQTTAYPTHYSIQIKKQSTGALITQLNDSTIAYYTRHSSGNTRVAAVFDAYTNGMSTGAHGIEVIITSYYSGGPTLASTTATTALINDMSGSPFESPRLSRRLVYVSTPTAIGAAEAR